MMLFIRSIIQNFNLKLGDFIIKRIRHYGVGPIISFEGDKNTINIGADQKELTIRDMKAALAEFKHNGPGVGGSKNPFRFSNVEKLLTMPSLYELPVEQQRAIQNYIAQAAKCNADTGIPGHVQQESKRLIILIEQHLEFIKNS